MAENFLKYPMEDLEPLVNFLKGTVMQVLLAILQNLPDRYS